MAGNRNRPEILSLKSRTHRASLRPMASISARNREPRAGRPLLPADYSNYESGRRKLLSWKWAVDRLRRAHTYWIVTVTPDGRPHAVPIWGVWLDDRFVFGTDANSTKVRNLKADPRCEICLEEDCEALTLEGEALELEDPKHHPHGSGLQNQVRTGPSIPARDHFTKSRRAACLHTPRPASPTARPTAGYIQWSFSAP